MRRFLIISGGEIDPESASAFLKGRSYDRIIAVDGGLDRASLLGVIPTDAVGDLDSADPRTVERYRESGRTEFEIHRPEKDETDTELALRIALRKGADEADILGALGGRFDHALANIQLLAGYADSGMKLTVYDSRNRIYLAEKRTVFRRKELYGKYISFLPLTERVSGLTLRGFKYPLERAEVTMGTSLLVSNELAEGTEEAVLELEEGRLLCVESHD